jgi:uncharacterized protein YPO0396
VTGGLFSPVELDDGDEERLSGFRLDKLEVYNWGTFDKQVWTFAVGARNGLLTGDIGSGKSTLVDAVSTLLLPAHRISYNKAAGAETKERSLRSYVMGFYKSERNEETGSARPVALRPDATSYSVILGVFVNHGYEATVTLAQVFWRRDGDPGQPDRFFVIADRDLSVVGDFSEFGTDMPSLRRRLRAEGVRVFDAFPEYGRAYRRALGIESEQAMELFHQTVAMKSVGDLNGFVRNHMLEPFDADSWTKRIVAHFEDLTKAHDAVRRAERQLAALEPLLADCDSYDKVIEDIAELSRQRSALRYYFADRKALLLTERIKEAEAHREDLLRRQKELRTFLDELRSERTRLELERAGHGGDRLSQIEALITDLDKIRDRRREKAERFGRLLAEAGMEPVESAEQFTARRAQIAAVKAAADTDRTDHTNALNEIAVAKRDLDSEAKELNEEITSLRSRDSSVPKRQLDLRQWLCAELGLDPAALPFAGELIRVRSEERAWEGAAERLLRSFALSLLVPEGHYAAVSEWINDHHLSGRLVYYRVPRNVASRRPDGDDAVAPLAAKLEIKDSGFFPWLERELAVRAAHSCVETMVEFRRATRAITKAGQIKDRGGRHVKDDSRRIDDRSTYVLGWSNKDKIEALLTRAQAVYRRQQQVAAEQQRLEEALDRAIERGQHIAALTGIDHYEEIDWRSAVNRIAALQTEKRQLEESSRELERLTGRLHEVDDEIAGREKDQATVQERLGATQKLLDEASTGLQAAEQIIDEPECERALDHFAAIAERLDEPPRTPEQCDSAERAEERSLTELKDRRADRQRRLVAKIVPQMGRFRAMYPVETNELDDSMDAANGYRELHRRLVDDDLPRFQRRFKEYLNTNTVRDIAMFQSELNKQRDLIRERISTINESLVGIDYNPGRYIRLEAQNTINTEIREFIADLRACTDRVVSGDDSDAYSEQKFLQVSRIIERFKGRESHTEADRKWTRLVTDVRNWFTFSASERWRESDAEYENYTDSGGKSGGQKEKLAYTILAASLAYQFKLEWGAIRSKTFRFAVIDEAFGRGSDESTRYALRLFRRLGLQLLIVTPLQKIHVIEPYVNSVGYVDNPAGNYSRLQTLTIEDYRARKRALALVTEASQ